MSTRATGNEDAIRASKLRKQRPCLCNYSAQTSISFTITLYAPAVRAERDDRYVYSHAKLPRGFLIPTPVGDYNPDWAISFKRGAVKHVYFMAETKGSMSSLTLREIEQTKIKCARKFFDEINQQIEIDKVKYDVVTDFSKLMDIISTRYAA